MDNVPKKCLHEITVCISNERNMHKVHSKHGQKGTCKSLQETQQPQQTQCSTPTQMKTMSKSGCIMKTTDKLHENAHGSVAHTKSYSSGRKPQA